MGTIETSLVRTPRQDNREAISIPIETQNIRPITRETRELMNQQKNNSVKEEIERLNNHKEAGCKDVMIKDINDNPYDDTHIHIKVEDSYLNKLADIILENEEIANTYNRQDVKNKLQTYIKAKGEIPERETIIKDVGNEMEQNAQREHEMPQPRR